MEIRGKVVLITGASEGIGAACAEAFRARGALLALTARSAGKLRLVGRDTALVLPGDITLPSIQETVINSTIERYGRIDVLINNAGVGLYTPAWLAPMEDARSLFELNFFAPLRLMQLAVPHMQRQGSGTIVNITSIASKITLPWLTLYSAGKHALSSLTDGLRMELGGSGVHLMDVCPGYVDTGFQSHILGGTVPIAVARKRKFGISAAQCALAIVRGVERRKRTVMTPGIGWLAVAATRLLPWLVDAQLTRINSRRPQPESSGA
jgi:short-subunit dehydrogenase